MKSKKLMAITVVLLFIFIAEAYLKKRDLLSNILFLIPPFLAVLTGTYTTLTYGLSNQHGRVMALLTTGLVFWFAGELLFFLMQFVFHKTPFPSIADIFYLIAYPLIFAGLVKEIIIHKVKWQNFNKLNLTLIVLILAALAVIVAYFGVYKTFHSGDPLFNNIVAMAYGIVDLILIIPSLFILKIAVDYSGGKLYNSWIMILLALMFMLTGDLFFAIYKDKYDALVWPYTLIDFAWIISYLLFAYSFFYTAATIKYIHLKLKNRLTSKPAGH